VDDSFSNALLILSPGETGRTGATSASSAAGRLGSFSRNLSSDRGVTRLFLIAFLNIGGLRLDWSGLGGSLGRGLGGNGSVVRLFITVVGDISFFSLRGSRGRGLDNNG
jgi:hypothetical protein